jgi:protein-export chaperone SecB
MTDQTTDQTAEQANQQAAMPVFNIEKIYVKDLSLEVPNAPAIFLEREAPQMDMQLNTQSAPVDTDNGIYQCELSLTITAKVKDKTAFLVELKQAGIFRIQNLPKEAMEPAWAWVVRTSCSRMRVKRFPTPCSRLASRPWCCSP